VFVVKTFSLDSFEKMPLGKQQELYQRQLELNRKNRMLLAVKV
jgi:hypothetical protein